MIMILMMVILMILMILMAMGHSDDNNDDDDQVDDDDDDDLHNCESIHSSSSNAPSPLEGVAGIRTPSKRIHFACTTCLDVGIQLDF